MYGLITDLYYWHDTTMNNEYKKTTDYTNLFEYHSIPKIHGGPDYEQLKNFNEKLKLNTTKIPIDLGGGSHGHLGLVLYAKEYDNVSAVPYFRPIHPGVLVIPPPTSKRLVTRRRIKYKFRMVFVMRP